MFIDTSSSKCTEGPPISPSKKLKNSKGSLSESKENTKKDIIDLNKNLSMKEKFTNILKKALENNTQLNFGTDLLTPMPYIRKSSKQNVNDYLQTTVKKTINTRRNEFGHIVKTINKRDPKKYRKKYNIKKVVLIQKIFRGFYVRKIKKNVLRPNFEEVNIKSQLSLSDKLYEKINDQNLIMNGIRTFPRISSEITINKDYFKKKKIGFELKFKEIKEVKIKFFSNAFNNNLYIRRSINEEFKGEKVNKKKKSKNKKNKNLVKIKNINNKFFILIFCDNIKKIAFKKFFFVFLNNIKEKIKIKSMNKDEMDEIDFKDRIKIKQLNVFYVSKKTQSFGMLENTLNI